MNTVVVVGASRGIGAAVAEHFSERAKRVVGVSRSKAVAGDWVQADLSSLDGIAKVANAVGNDVLDAVLYMGGTWETNAFTADYVFERCSDEDILNVINVNLLAPIRLVKALLSALRKSQNAKIVFAGALSGLENFPAREVANSASKFGLRGVVHSLREELRPDKIGVSVLNFGTIGTPEVIGDLQQSGKSKENAVPLSDLLRLLDCVLSVSRSTCVTEIDLPAMSDAW